MLKLPSCKEVTQISSQLLDEDLSWQTRIKLRLHLAVCRSCRRYLIQMRLTSHTIKMWMYGKRMPQELRQKLIEEFHRSKDCDRPH